jgi:hypothetical protein
MADVKFSDFTDGGEMQIGDIPVGLRPSDAVNNYKFNFPGSGIKDSSGNYLFQYDTVGALAVNYLKFVNSQTGNAVLLTAGGIDSNINIAITPPGTGALYLDNLKWPTSDGLPDTLIYTDGAGNLGFSELIAGTNISINNIGTSITISASGSGGGFSWNVVTGTSQNMAINNGYIANNASLVTLNLPPTSSVGDALSVIGKGTGGWLIQCGVGQTIVLGSSTTSSGGSLSSTNQNDALYIICTVANNEWHIGSAPQGNITVS